MNKQKSVRTEIAGRLRAARTRAHLSLEDAARAVNVQPLAIKKWERGASLPSLLELRDLLPLYGVMAGEVLFEGSPIRLSPEQAAELRTAAAQCSPGLRCRLDLILSVAARAMEPHWKSAALGDPSTF